MAKTRKPQATLESTLFSTPEQKVLRFLLSEPTSTFTPRVIASKLKGIRGLGGPEGMMKILGELEELGMVQFVDNQKSVRLNDEHPSVRVLKVVASMCDLEGLKAALEPLSTKGVLFGCRAEGKAATQSEYDLLVVSTQPEEVRRLTTHHPIGKAVVLKTIRPEEFSTLPRKEPALNEKLNRGVVIWGATW